MAKMPRPEPSPRNSEMEIFLTSITGVDRVATIRALKCVPGPMGCGKQLTQEEYEAWDSSTQKEYTISGLCATCQKEIFEEHDDEQNSEDY